MKITLPRLTDELDCGPMGYPGLVFVQWLNSDFHEPEEGAPENAAEAEKAGTPWDMPFYRQVAHILDCVRFSGDYTEDGESMEMPIPDAEAVWNLERMEGFDPQLMQWATGQMFERRQERLQAARKNS